MKFYFSVKTIWAFLFSFLFILILFIFFIRDYYIDFLWFESQNQTQVFWKNLDIKYRFHVIGFILSLFFYICFYFISSIHLKKIYPPNTITTYYKAIFLTIAVFLSLFLHGNTFSKLGLDFLRWLYSKSFGISDPITNTDISFFLLKLPFYNGILNWFYGLIFFNLIFIIGMFYLPVKLANIRGIYKKNDILTRFGFLASILVAILLILFSLEFYLKIYHLIIEGSSELISGASYIDVHIKIPLYKTLFFITLLIGITVFIGFLYRNWKVPAILLGLLFIIYIFGIIIYPQFILNFKVKPNEYALEQQFIQYDIQYTRMGYKLDQVKKSIIDFNRNLDPNILKKHSQIINNIRLWDYRPAKETFKQLQEIRLYYEFYDIDLDRYKINGIPRQVLISARELNINELPQQAQQWIPLHLQYTHGYGVVVAPTNIVSREGLPEFWIKDFPPKNEINDLPIIQQPEIYYGELTNHYVIVNTKIQEINYPEGNSFVSTNYKGHGGILIGSGLRKLMIALKYDTWKILVSEYIVPESRILINRNIKEAVRKLAPFLIYDNDPYIVIGKDGKLYWIMDAFTASSNFPYSKKINPYNILYYLDKNNDFNRISELNYIRNSVKVIIDAYNGKISYYQFDEDPLLETYKQIYPNLIRPKEEIPDYLLEHVRYPEMFFFLQSVIYTDYHMDNSETFYTREDRWQIGSEILYNKEQIIEPYYVILNLDDKEYLETVLMIPFIPKNKQNLIAWMAARCDNSSNYGEIIVYEIPRTKQIYGPMQIESRIDQDTEISKDLTLWNQQGSSVIRGNLLIIPIKDFILYVEPIYLQASQSPFPELKRVVVATGSDLAIGENLESAIRKLVSQSISSNTEIVQENTYTKSREYMLLLKAKEELQKGNWKKFGEFMQELEDLLKNK